MPRLLVYIENIFRNFFLWERKK